MKAAISIALQSVLVALALTVTILRSWIKLRLDRRGLTFPEYFAWGAWVFTLGWFVCSTIALRIQVQRPLDTAADPWTNSESYMVAVFVGECFFDIGMFFPKASILSFYWWLVPIGFRRLRIALYAGTAFTACAFLSSFLMNMSIAGPISNNWSIENESRSLWNSYAALIVNWCSNSYNELLVFVLPFFIISCLKLRVRQKVALCGIFSLGLITISLSLGRFIIFMRMIQALDDSAGNLWYTAEISTATIVVSLPALKPLIMKVSPYNTTASGGYARESLHQSHQKTIGSARPTAVNRRISDDDEIELVHQESRKSSLTPATRTISDIDRQEVEEDAKSTGHITVVGKVV